VIRSTSFGLIVFCIGMAGGAARAADDTIKKTSGEQIKAAIESVSKEGIKYTKSGKEESLAPNEIDSIRFSGEPAQLLLIRNQVSSGAYDNALKALDKIDAASQSRSEVKQDIAWLRAYCNAQMAFGGGATIADAYKLVNAFIKENSNSYHFYPAHELAGDLLLAAGKFKDALGQYEALKKSPLEAYKMLASIHLGRAKLAEKNYADALTDFDQALALADKADDAAESQKLAAMLGKATCLAETNKPDEGVKLVEEVLGKLSSPEEQADLHGRAYVSLGNCYRKLPNHTKQALLAYLHVDVLFSANPQTHAEALWNVAALYAQLGQVDRAVEATNLLKERYPNSPWAKM
jgi:tetratricopeptide (TPR) repeat protein